MVPNGVLQNIVYLQYFKWIKETLDVWKTILIIITLKIVIKTILKFILKLHSSISRELLLLQSTQYTVHTWKSYPNESSGLRENIEKTINHDITRQWTLTIKNAYNVYTFRECSEILYWFRFNTIACDCRVSSRVHLTKTLCKHYGQGVMDYPTISN